MPPSLSHPVMPPWPAYTLETLTVAWLVLVVPVRGRRRYRRLGADTLDRVAFYRRTAIRQWLVPAAAVAALAVTGVPPGRLGLVRPDGGSVRMLPALLEVVALGLLVVVALRWQASRRPDRAVVDRLMRPVRALLPRTRVERRGFALVAVGAGVGEEVLYRGLVTLWVAQTVPSLGAGGALLVSSAGFGLAHAYQGALGVVLTGVAGYALGATYLATGSLLAPMVLHALLDLRVLLLWPVDPVADTTSANGPSAPSGMPRSTPTGSVSSP